MTLSLDVLVLPAFDDLAGLPGETTPWEQGYEFKHEREIAGIPAPLRYTDTGLGLVPTGVGKSNAATTATALATSERLDLSGTTLLTVGVAGAPPTVPVGSVVVSEAIVDWDDKCRFDDADTGEEQHLAMNPYTEEQGCYEPDSELVEETLDCARSVDLDTPAESDRSPELLTGTNLCGDELWHGDALAGEAEWLVNQYDLPPYRVTEMEDAGTAAALDRCGYLDQYCSVRGVSNHDRPTDEQSARESFFSESFEDGFGVAVENAVAVARELVEHRL